MPYTDSNPTTSQASNGAEKSAVSNLGILQDLRPPPPQRRQMRLSNAYTS